jgi:hypothetical protein
MINVNAERLWNDVVHAIHEGSVPLHLAVALASPETAEAWRDLSINSIRDVMRRVSEYVPTQTAFALDLTRRVASSVAARDPEDAALAWILIEAVERASSDVAPDMVDLKPVRERLKTLRNHALREMIKELSWWVQAPGSFPPTHTPFLTPFMEQLASDELRVTGRDLLLSFGPPTLEQIVAAAEAHAAIVF